MMRVGKSDGICPCQPWWWFSSAPPGNGDQRLGNGQVRHPAEPSGGGVRLPDAYLGVVDACLSREIDRADELPPEARAAWQVDWWGVHTIDWWRRHWGKTGLVRVLCAELLPESEIIKQRYVDRFRHDPR